MTQTHIKTLFWVTIVLLVVPQVLGSLPPSWAPPTLTHDFQVFSARFKPYSPIIALFMVLLGIFDTHIWRWRVLHPWFVPTPNLQGTWKGQLTSTYKDSATGATLQPFDVFLVVRQTLSTVSVQLLTKESISSLLGGTLTKEPSGRYILTGTYLNTPKVLLQDKSPMHQGAMVLTVCGDIPYALEGHYWTTRETKGELNFTEQTSKLYHDFASAAGGKYEKKQP